MPISGVNLTPRPTAVYASDPALPRRPQDSLPSCLLGFERTRLALASSYQLSYRTPHRAPAGSQAWSMFGAWAAHTVSTRGPMPPGTCLIRLCVRGMRRHRPLLPAGSLPSTPSAAAPRGLVRGFIGTMDPSDSSDLPIRLRLLAFPNRPGTALVAAGSRRSPRFRRDPFVRDVASDPGRATVPRITAPHMLPSAIATASAPATSRFSWLNPTPHTIAVYASPWSSPSTAQHSLPGGRYPLPVSPAGPRQLCLAHRYSFTVMDSHHLLLAGLPGAHRKNPL